MIALDYLQQAKNVWDLLHTVGGGTIKNGAGEKYVFVQGATGGVIVDVAGGDTWDEILVGITGDVVQAIVAAPFGVAGVVVESSWIIAKGAGASNSSSLGDIIKDYYKTIKTDVASQYWKYEKNFYYMKAGTMLHLDYAKVLYDRSGAVMMANEQVVQATYELQYNEYIASRTNLQNQINNTQLNTKIENTNGVLKVTMPDGTVYAMGDDASNTINGGAKNDVLFGSGGNDTLNGGAGDDQLYGQVGADKLNGGDGYDKYYSGNGDTIMDSDGSGAIYLGGEHLDGGEKKVIKHIGVTTTNYTKTFIYCECRTVTKWSDVTTDEWKEEEAFYIDKATGTKYVLSGSTLSVISASGTITINNFSDRQLGISLNEKETIDKKNVEHDVFLEEDFCSPLILDINNNGNSSTRLNDSNVYFDMDGDGFKERTAWVEQGDGLLVLDRNGNGMIDNGTELFGNFTPLSSGNSASDGFEALLQYDENHDGKIDRNDAAYQNLRVWMDDNQNGITDSGELKNLSEAGVASVKLNPYQTLLSFFDSNADSVLNTQDDVYNYILMRHDDNGGVTLFIPQTDNETAKKLFDSFKGHEIITTSNGTLLINGVSFASLENIATEGADTLTGTTQNDKIIALGGNDTLDADAGNDIVEAGAGDDSITGGKGNDLLRGGMGNDTYMFGKGDGIDTIEEIGGTDRIVFGNGIAHDGILTAIVGNDLIIALKDGNKPFNELSDQIILADWFTQTSRVETFQFGDNVIYNASDILSNLSLYEDSTMEGRVIAPDAASGVSSFVLIDDVQNGTLQFNADGTYRFDAAGFDTLRPNESAQITFKYAALDAQGNQGSVKEMTLNVMGVNDAPTAHSDYYIFDVPTVFKLVENNLGTGSAMKAMISGEAGSTLSFTWNFSTSDYMPYNDFAFVILNNEIYKLSDVSIVGNYGSSGNKTFTFTLPSDGVYTMAIGAINYGDNSVNSTVTISNMSVSSGVVLSTEFKGVTSANSGTYQISTVGGVTPEQLNIFSGTQASSLTLPVNGSITINSAILLSNDKDVESDTLSIVEVSDAVHGTVTLNQYGYIQFTADANYSGEASFSYKISDGKGGYSTTQSHLFIGSKPANYVAPIIMDENIQSSQENSSSIIINQKTSESDITIQNITGQNDSYENLQQAGIETINLESAYVDDSENGNPVTYVGNYTDTDGIDHTVSDVWFDRDSYDTQYAYTDTIGNTILALPESSGHGRTKDLSMRMAEDASVVTTLQTLVSESKTLGWNTLNATMDTLLAKWTQTETINVSQTRGVHSVLNHSYAAPSTVGTYRVYAYARNVAILETFTGTSFAMTVNGVKTTNVEGSEMAEEMRAKYEHLHYDQLAKLIAQDLLGKSVYDSVSDTLDIGAVLNNINTILLEETDTARRTQAVNLLSALMYRDGMNPALIMDKSIFSMSDVSSQLSQAGINLTLSDIEMSGTIGRYRYGTSDDDIIDYGGGDTHAKMTASGKTIYAGEGNDIIIGTNSHDVIEGGNGDDVIRGYAGDDLLYGGNGNDTIYATQPNPTDTSYGHSIIEGGRGDDTLYGTGRQTTFVYRYGDGNDTIIDGGNVGSIPDVIEFRDIQSDDIKIVSGTNPNDMLILIRDMESGSFDVPSGSVLIVNGFGYAKATNGSFSGGSGAMEQFVFEDTVLSYEALSQIFPFGDNVYSFGIGDGTVMIEEIKGHDKLYFPEGVTTSNIRVKFDSEGTVFIGIYEEGVAFDSFTDKLMLKNGVDSTRQIEEFIFPDGTIWDIEALRALQSGTAEDDYLAFSTSHSNLIVNALAGNDTVLTGSGSDTINGGTGADRIFGSSGNDTYVYALGDGHDTIMDTSGSDTLKFTDALPAQIEVLKEGTDLIVGIKEDGALFSDLQNTIRLKDWYIVENRIEQFVFESDATVWNISQIHELVPNKEGVIIGTEVADILTTDPLYNAIVYAQGGDDTIIGSARNDLIYAQAGNDLLNAHEGNDLLYGGEGNDTYVYAKGDGIDLISDSSGIDQLRFADTVSPEDLIIRRIGESVVIALNEPGVAFDDLSDKITLQNWYRSDNRIETIAFSDGTLWQDIALVALMGSDGMDDIIGLNGDNVFNGKNGDDILRGKNGNDTYLIGVNEGNDTIIDSYGQDRIVFKAGVLPENIHIEWQQGTENIRVRIASSEDAITIKEWYGNGRIEAFEFSNGTLWNYQQIIDAMATEYDDVYKGVSEANNVIYTLNGDDIVTTFGGNDLIDGGAGNDVLESGSGNDTLIGAGGDDMLIGGDGNDIYRYELGYGRDIISDLNGVDTLVFGAGITKEQLQFKVSGTDNNLMIAIVPVGTGEIDFNTYEQTILIEGWFDTYHRIENFSFANGEALNVAGLMQLFQTNGSDHAKALFEGSTLTTADGDDTIFGNDGNDVILSGNGNDILRAGKGADILDAGAGVDNVNAQGGNDTYKYDRGYGVDVFNDLAQESYTTYGYITDPVTNQSYWGQKTAYRTINGGIDTLEFGSGVTIEGIAVRIDGADLLIGLLEDGKSFNELNDVVRIKNFADTNQKIENVRFANGTLMGINDLLGYVFTEGDDTVTLNDNSSYTVNAKAGNDTVVFGNGADTVSGAAGDDVLSTQGGNDTLNGGIGNDTLNGGTGNDTYLYTLGDGNDVVFDTGGLDTLLLNGVALSDIDVRLENNDLIVTMPDQDIITLKSWFLEANRIETIQTSIGEILDINVFLTPVVEDYTIVMAEDNSANGTISVVTVAQLGLTFELISSENGHLALNAQTGVWSYQPTANFYGNSTAQIRVTNQYGLSAVSTVTFEITLVNDTPEAPIETTNTLQDIRVLSGEVGATDIDGDILTYTVSTAASHGTLSVNEAGVWSYTAADGYMGTDSAVITIDDSNGGVIEQTVSFEINVSSPILSDSASTLLEDTLTSGTLSVVNPIGGALVHEVLNASTKGLFSVNETGEWNYTPSSNLNGNDSVTLKVTNSYGLSTTATLNLAIEAVNDAPILTETPIPATLLAGTSATGALKTSDIDGDILNYTISSAPANGSLSIDAAGAWNYSAERYYAGQTTAIVNINDGHGGSVATTLNFTNLMTPDWHYTYGGETMTINDSDGLDALMMDNISMANLTFLQEGNNLRIDIKDKNDVILTDYFTSPTQGIESIQTMEGTINLSKEYIGIASTTGPWQFGSTLDDLIACGATSDRIYGRDGDDTIFGNAGDDGLSGDTGNDLLIGGAGNDSLNGGEGHDILYGDVGNDTLNSDQGDDKLLGGVGNNLLLGGAGNDSYLFAKGANNTIIEDKAVTGNGFMGGWASNDGGNDTLFFSKGISKEDISFLMNGHDLLLQYGLNETITVKNQDNTTQKIEKFELEDGSYLSNTDIDLIVQQMNAYSRDNGFSLTNQEQIRQNQALTNIVSSGWHTL